MRDQKVENVLEKTFNHLDEIIDEVIMKNTSDGDVLTEKENHRELKTDKAPEIMAEKE